MGTRGAIGVRLNGKDFLTYNHWDSNPSGKGVGILHELRGVDLNSLTQLVAKLVVVKEGARPTVAQLKVCYPYLREKTEDAGVERDETFEEMVKRLDDQNVSEPGRHWYKTLRQTQGTLSYLLAGLPFFIGGGEIFVYDSSCEWAYIANLDTSMLEIYSNKWTHSAEVRGYYPVKKPRGRYAMGENGALGDGYPGALLLEEIPLDDLAIASDKAIDKYCARLDRLATCD